MRTHTQLKIFFAGVLVVFGTLTQVTAPQVLGAEQSKNPFVVTSPQDARGSAQGGHSALLRTGSAEDVGLNRSPKRTTNSRTATAAGPLSFLPAVPYYSGGYEAFSVAVADVNGDGKPDGLVVNYCITINCTNGLVGVLLGNGDGTFQPVVSYASGKGEAALWQWQT